MNRFRTPSGVADIFGQDCALKSSTIRAVSDTFEKFGYSEIQTPAFEYWEVFGSDSGIPSDEAIKFIDQSGKLLALRQDFTTSISRAVASHMANEPLPLRLWYSGNVYRSGESYKNAKKKEFTQSGVEIIGANTPEADAEVIALTINALLASGLEDFTIELTHSGFLQGIAEHYNLNEASEDELRDLIDRKFAPGVKEFCMRHGIDNSGTELLTHILLGYGNGGDVLKSMDAFKLNPVSKNALCELGKVYEILKSYSLEQYVTIDLSQIRSFRYYTGVIFRGFTSASAFPICGGGRYNTLGRRFDFDEAATGVAIWIDRLTDALKSTRSTNCTVDAIIFTSEENRCEAYKLASQLRSEGKKVILDVCSPDKENAKKSSAERSISNVYFI